MLGHGLEIAAVITLTSLLSLFWLPPQSVSRLFLAVAIISLGLLLLSAAIGCAYAADVANEKGTKKAQEDAEAKTYVISETRIEVLKELGVPHSVRNFLNSLISSKVQLGQKEFDVSGEEALAIKGLDLATALSNGLGSQIMGQFKDTIFKYTLKDVQAPDPDAAKDQTQGTSTPAEVSANSQVTQLKPDPASA